MNNKDYKTSPELKSISDRYWKVKMLFDSASNGDNEARNLIRENISIEQARELAMFVAECENFGIQRVGRIIN